MNQTITKDYWVQYWEKFTPNPYNNSHNFSIPKYQHFDVVLVNDSEIEILGVLRSKNTWEYVYFNSSTNDADTFTEKQIKALVSRENHEIINPSNDIWVNYWQSKGIESLPKFRYDQGVIEDEDFNVNYFVIGIVHDEGWFYAVSEDIATGNPVPSPNTYIDETIWWYGNHLTDAKSYHWESYWACQGMPAPKFQYRDEVIYMDKLHIIKSIENGGNYGWHYTLEKNCNSIPEKYLQKP